MGDAMMPESIWAEVSPNSGDEWWTAEPSSLGEVTLTKYIRADLHAARIAELEAQVAGIATPTDPGSFVGDIWFGHPVKTTLGTHRWDGAEWQFLPSETDCLLELLAASRAQVAKLVEALTRIRNYCAHSPTTQAEINCAAWADATLSTVKREAGE